MVAVTEVFTQNIKREGAMTVTWRFPPNAASKEKTVAGRDRREYFMRSASLDRLRRFPAYICTRSSDAFPNVLLFLNVALSAFQSSLKSGIQLLKRYCLAGTVIAALIIVFLQLIFCIGVLIAGSKPLGLIFLLASLMLMSAIAYRTFVNEEPVMKKCKRF